MIAAFIMFSFIMAILAHVKIFMFQRSMTVLYDMLLAKETVVIKETPVYPDVDPVFLQQFYKLNDAQRKTLYHDLAGAVSLQTYNAMYNACFMKNAVERAHELQSAMFSMNSSELEAVRKLVQDVLWVPKDLDPKMPPVPATGPPSTGPKAPAGIQGSVQSASVQSASLQTMSSADLQTTSSADLQTTSSADLQGSFGAFKPIKVAADTMSMPAQDSVPTSAPSKAPEISTTAMIEPTNEIKIAEPIKLKTRRATTKRVLAPETIIPADL